MSKQPNGPFFGPIPESTPLPNTPLSSVLAQLRFPAVLKIDRRDGVADFQDRIRKQYPNTQRDPSITISVKPDGSVEQEQSAHWRFLDVSNSWRVSLTTTFLAIETRDYSSRKDFCDRLEAVATALAETIDPGFIERIGVRYVDHIHGELYKQLPELISEEMLGPFGTIPREHIFGTNNQVRARTDEGVLAARWGFLPPSETHDPEMMPAIDAPSWFLDIDSVKSFGPPVSFDAAQVRETAFSLASRAYAFFRWATKEALLKQCGGNP